MKTTNFIKKLGASLILLMIFCCANIFAQTQIIAPSSDFFLQTEYIDPNIPEDTVFIWCSNNPQAGSLEITNIGGCDVVWWKYDGMIYGDYIGNTATINNLESGGYEAIVTCGASVVCYKTWVFVNQTIADIDPIPAGCDPFTLSGIADAVENFTVYDPPPSPFIVDASTEITVCFSADHTYVSDLGFYLKAPGYQNSEPGDPGCVELLPPVSNWSAGYGGGVTDYSPHCIGNPGNINTNCQSGEDVNNVCFTTNMLTCDPVTCPAINCNATDHPNVCALPVPLTGTWGSVGIWSTIYPPAIPGANAADGGWSVQIYDCELIDFGWLTHASLSFTGVGECGPATFTYDSGPINSQINDMSCDAISASIYTIPMVTPNQYDIINTLSSAVWSSTVPWNPLWGDTDFNNNPNPNIDPIPTVNTTFCLTVTDNLGCVQQHCELFVTLPTDATITGTVADPGILPIGPFCTNDPLVYLEAVDPGGVWTCVPPSPCAIQSSSLGSFNPANPGAGTYVIQYEITGVCGSLDQTTIVVDPNVSVSNPLDTQCIVSNTMYLAEFDISGGIVANFTVYDSTNGIDVSGNIDGSGHFCDTIPSQDTVYFIVDNGTGCGTITIMVYENCGCLTNSGSISQNTLILCEEDLASPVYLGGYNSDDDDTLVFYLHTNPWGYLGTLLDSNHTGEFYFKPAIMTFGTTYYISPAAANNDGSNFLDHTDVCFDVAVGTPVMWLEDPTAYANLDDNVCGMSYNLQAIWDGIGLGEWTCVTSGVVYGPAADAPDAEVTVPTFGDYEFTWTVTNGPCNDTNNVIIKFIPNPLAYSGADDEVCGLEYDLQAVLSLPPTESSGTWSGPGDFSNDNDPNATVTADNYGTFMFTWTEESTLGGCSDDDYVSITFIQQPQTNAGHNASTCGNCYDLKAINVVGSGYWTTPFVSGITYGCDTCANTNACIISSVNDTTITFVWHEANGMCTGVDSVDITFAAGPFAYAGIDDGVCGNEYQLQADTTSSFAVGTWVADIAGVEFDSINLPDAVMTIPPFGVFDSTSTAVICVNWILDNHGCTDIDEVCITFFEEPVAFAGMDTFACGKDINLQAEYSIENSNGTWSSSNPGATTFDNNTDPNTEVTVTQYGIYYFYWEEKNSLNPSCKITDTVEVEFIEVPAIHAGNDTTVCGKEIDLNCTGSIGTGQWEMEPGMTFNDSLYSFDPNAHGIYAAYDTVWLVWVEYVGICVERDEVQIIFAQQPDANDPMWMDTINIITNPGCGTDYITLQAPNPNIPGAVSYWWDEIAGTTFHPVNPSDHFNDTARIDPGQYGLHTFHWIINNSGCIDTSAAINIYFIEKPTPDAGPRYDTACGDTYVLDGLQSIDTSIVTWSSLDPLFIIFASTGNTTGDTIHDTVMCNLPLPQIKEIYLTESNGMCTTRDTITVTFSRIPNSDFKFAAPKCYHYSFEIQALEDTLAGYPGLPGFQWDFGSGVLDSMSARTAPTPPLYGPEHDSSLYVSWDADSLHIVTLITTNSHKCPSAIYTDTLYEPPSIKPHFTIVGDSCLRGVGYVSVYAIGGFGYPDSINPNVYYMWADTLSIDTLFSDTVQNYLMAGEYPIRITDLYGCFTDISAFIPEIGQVTAMFDTAEVYASQTVPFIAPAPVTFTNTSIDGDEFEWYFLDSLGNVLDNGISDDENLEFTFPEKGAYIIKLIAWSKEGCVDTFIFKHADVTWNSLIEVPNVFTPNGDGVNDIFQVKAKTLISFKGVIVNRWGKKIYEWDEWEFEIDREKKGWDGTIGGDGGPEAAPGVYYYIIDAIGEDNKGNEIPFKFQGALHLIRGKE